MERLAPAVLSRGPLVRHQARLRRGARIRLSTTTATSARMAGTTSPCAMLLCAGVWRTLRASLSHAFPQALDFAQSVPRPRCPALMCIVKAEGRKKCARWSRKWSVVAFSADLGLRSEVGRRFGEGHSSVHIPTGSDFVVRRRDRTGGPRQVRERPAHSEDPGGGELGADRTCL